MKYKFPPWTEHYLDRHGRPRFYLRRPGVKRVALPGLPWSEEFMTAREAALKGSSRQQIGASRTSAGSVSQALVNYYVSTSFTTLSQDTQTRRRQLLERFRALHGDKPIARLELSHIAQMLNQFPAYAQRHWRQALRGLMAHARNSGMITADPTADYKLTKAKSSAGFYSWEESDIAQFERRHPVGSKARLAFAIMLYTAARKSDCVRLGPQHISDGEICRFAAAKTDADMSGIPIHPELARIIQSSPSGHLAFLMTERGRRQ